MEHCFEDIDLSEYLMGEDAALDDISITRDPKREVTWIIELWMRERTCFADWTLDWKRGYTDALLDEIDPGGE